jgi:hypothetical protein
MDKQYYWERAEEAIDETRSLLYRQVTEESNGRMVALARVAEVNLKMMEVAPDSE